MLRVCVRPFLGALFLFAPAVAGAIELQTVLVGDPGNPDDTVDGNPSREGIQTYGGVANAYRMGKYEVTNSQYVEFLNFKAKDDPTNLYIPFMATDPHGGITRAGSPGSYTYAPRTGMENRPVAFVTWYDAARFVNWLHNGGGNGDMETGAYTMSLGAAAARNPDAKWFMPTKDEWYKAAYYQPAAAGGDADGYWLYPTQTNLEPYSDQPAGAGAPNAGNTANFFKDDSAANGFDDGYAVTGASSGQAGQQYLTEVGAYALSSSYYGTFDQGGNVWEWNEASYSAGETRGLWGGCYSNTSGYLGTTFGYYGQAASEANNIGFRVASIVGVPEPNSLAMALLGAVATVLMFRNRARC